jgi:uncharacterized protein involved in exopolysaccharide biosynthesis
MIRQSQPAMSARDFTRILFRHGAKGLAFFVAVVALAVAGVLLMPRMYESEAKFFVKLDLKVDPIATNEGQTVLADTNREGEMQTVVALLRSRGLLDQVIDKLGADKIFESDLKTGPLDQAIASLTALLPQSDSGEAVQRENALRQLARTLQIDHPKNSHVVNVTYKSRSADRAKEVLDAYAAACMQQHLAVNQDSNSYEFFVEQEKLLKEQVSVAQQALRDTKNQVGLVTLASQRNVLEQHVTGLERAMLDQETELASTLDRIESLRKQLPFELQNPATGSALSTRAADEMRNQLFTHELRYRDLLSRYRSTHPQVVAAKEQIEESAVLLNQQQLRNELSMADSLQSKAKSLKADYQATSKRLLELNEAEVRVAELERRVTEVTEAHRVYIRKLEQARLDKQLQADAISNLRLAQAPTLMGKPLSRKGALIVGLALLAGLFGAGGVAYVSELMDESLATPTDVEESLGLPVLMSLPRAPSRELSYN